MKRDASQCSWPGFPKRVFNAVKRILIGGPIELNFLKFGIKPLFYLTAEVKVDNMLLDLITLKIKGTKLLLVGENSSIEYSAVFSCRNMVSRKKIKVNIRVTV